MVMRPKEHPVQDIPERLRYNSTEISSLLKQKVPLVRIQYCQEPTLIACVWCNERVAPELLI
jgi:hypothetical protein